MDIVKYLVFFITLAIVFVAWLNNKDIFSPLKIYIAYSTFFYVGIYTNEVLWETLLCYVGLILSVGACLLFEPRIGRVKIYVECPDRVRLYRSIWLISLPGILVKMYFIYEAGGLFEYLFSLAFRVQEWAGKGHLVVWFYMLPALNLLYFCAIISDERRKTKDVVLYALHFIIFLAIGLITGSRSYVAITLLGMLVMYSYLLKPLKLRWIAIAGLFLTMLVGAIGAARNDFGNMGEANLLESATSVDQFETTQNSYGVIPLEIIFKGSDKPLKYGSTYFSLFTNFIPRNIYPDKPETGGIAFTKIYADDQWGGLSNLATGAITEAVLNFGIYFGIPFGVFINLIFLVYGCFYYRRLVNEGGSVVKRVSIFRLVIYFYLILGVARFSYAEFTDIFHSMLFYAVIPFYILAKLNRSR
jgi:oligosaccharide repeat unit polymerase